MLAGAAPLADRATPTPSAPAAAPLRVLLVEDDPEDAAIIRLLLLGSEVGEFLLDCVDRLGAALERLAETAGGEEAPDVVLLDLGLPDARGIETLHKLLGAARGRPIVVLTGLDDEGVAAAALRLGAEDYLVKTGPPPDPRLLGRTLRHAVERHRFRLELEALAEELRAANARLEELADLDPLTELVNRRGLQRALTRDVEAMWRGERSLVVALVDLDEFKRVNDRLGHATGDLVLREVARRIRDSVRPGDVAARVGGDEFLVLLRGARLAEGAEVGERLRRAIAAAHVALPREELRVTASVGVVRVTEATPSVDEVLSEARFALARSKRSGKDRVAVDGEERDPAAAPAGAAETAAAERQAVIAELRLGKRLRVVKQPILALGDERVVGYELLSRLDLPHLELPEDFFRISMEASILTLVDHECLRRCVAASASLPPGTARHVNLFPSTLVDVPAEHLLAALGAGGVPPGTTCVEVSEQQIVGEPSYLVGPVAALRQAGVRFAIDDLGFGSSSIESLVLLEPDVVKIDRRFVRGIAKRRRQAGALERLLRVATSLGASVVAEGIETREDLKRLRELGVGYGQGFLWGPPR